MRLRGPRQPEARDWAITEAGSEPHVLEVAAVYWRPGRWSVDREAVVGRDALLAPNAVPRRSDSEARL